MIDEELRDILHGAKKRGSRYVKADFRPDQLARQISEFGVYLLETGARKLEAGEGGLSLEELNDLQKKADHFRGNLFRMKRSLLR